MGVLTTYDTKICFRPGLFSGVKNKKTWLVLGMISREREAYEQNNYTKLCYKLLCIHSQDPAHAWSKWQSRVNPNVL